jgi:hypothetical protein
MGFGKSSGSTSVQMTPEQQRALALQTDALEKTFLPAYQNTVTGALDVANKVMPVASSYASKATDVAGQTGALQQGAGSSAYLSGLGGQQGLAGYQQNLGQGLTGYGSSQLAQLFSPAYKEEQIQASLQPAREAIREQLGSQNAMYGAAGGLGSSRMALADKNLAQLGQQRLQSAAAQTSAAVEGQRQAAAQSLLGAGQTATGQAGGLYGSLTGAGQAGLSAANQAAASQIGYAQTPQDIYSKYASVVYGTPQASTNPNFAGTQGQTTSSKGMGFKL